LHRRSEREQFRTEAVIDMKDRELMERQVLKANSVLISGVGIGGPTLAYWLTAAGFRPTLVERAPAARAGGYVIDFWGLGYDIAERMGLAADISRHGYNNVGDVKVVDDQGDRVAGFDADVIRNLTAGRYVTLARSDLSRLLLEKVRGTSEVLFGDEVTAIHDGPDGVRVEFEHASERRSDLVIGADGLHSNIRRLVFGPHSRFERQLGYAVAAFEVRRYRPREENAYVMYNQPGRMIGRFALRDDRTLFLFIFADDSADRLSELSLPDQKSILRRIYADGRWECPSILRHLDEATDLYVDSVSQIRMNAWARGRICLVGDAAFCVSLAAGQGSALAMTAAYVLAGELACAERHVDAFRRYETRLRPYIESKQRGAVRFAAALAPKTWWGLFLRNQVISAAALPGVARLTFGADIVDKLDLPDYSGPARRGLGV
jgi:2-polyprenyl-6-methoxyphenol hydroxylase-like FAD-dependent oxidoreductase